MHMPDLQAASTSRDVTDTFYGYNHKMKIGAGEFFDMKNLSSRDYPMLSTRMPRALVKHLHEPQGLLAKETLCYVNEGTLYVNGEPTELTGLKAGKKQIVSMGAYICIFPDKMYYNTADTSDYGSMEAFFSPPGTVTYQLCLLTGEELEPIISDTEPAEPENLSYWLDTSTNSLKQYNSNSGGWVTIVTVYTKITFETYGDVPGMFKIFDGITIGGTPFPNELDGSKLIYGIGGDATHQDYIIVVGLIDSYISSAQAASISRTVPNLDYVCECQNRLWGCYYGPSGTGNLNEIYCCALGDFRNWSVYQGISTDSWTASVGSDGPWTGAINYLGYPTFFKEERIHRVNVSATGGHSITETVCRGVQRGSAGSLAIVNETLFYKSRSDVCAYQGGFPDAVSAALGEVNYSDAVAGAYGDCYYISMKSEEGWNLFVYDTSNGLWTKQDDLHVTSFARVGDELYAIDEDNELLLALRGTVGAPEVEQNLSWMSQSGILYYEYPDRKYISRYDIRLSAKVGSTVNVFIQYDSDGLWRPFGSYHFKGLNTITFPIRPRRCDHMELRLTGNGPVKIYSIARILEQGSDV